MGKLANRGIKKLQEYGHGDHIVTLQIEVPSYDSLTEEQLEAIKIFGADEKFSGWASSITQNNKSRKKYDKKSRKFYTEEEAMGEREDKEDEIDEDIIEDVKKMEKKLKEDGLKASASVKNNKDKTSEDEKSEEEELLAKNEQNKQQSANHEELDKQPKPEDQSFM